MCTEVDLRADEGCRSFAVVFYLFLFCFFGNILKISPRFTSIHPRYSGRARVAANRRDIPV